MTQWWTLAELHDCEPDPKDHVSAIDGLVYGGQRAGARLERRTCAHRSHRPFQLADDPKGVDGESKIESIRQTIRDGRVLPHVVTWQWPKDEWPYWLVEGRRRYNGVHRDGC